MKKYSLPASIMFIIFLSCGNKQNNTLVSPPSVNENPSTSVIPASVEIKLAAFRNVGELRNKLSENGIGELRKWRGDAIGWMSSSEYFSFGSASNDNGMKNNLAYYLESNSENYVSTLKLVLNINNAAEKEQAIKQFKKLVTNTFKIIQSEMPKGIFDQLQSGKDFYASDTNFTTSVSLDKSKIDTWRLIVETK